MFGLNYLRERKKNVARAQVRSPLVDKGVCQHSLSVEASKCPARETIP